MTAESYHFTEVYTYGSRFHEALYVLAGERFHAVRLRPKVGQTTRPEVPEDGDVFGDEPPVGTSGEDSPIPAEAPESASRAPS